MGPKINKILPIIRISIRAITIMIFTRMVFIATRGYLSKTYGFDVWQDTKNITEGYLMEQIERGDILAKFHAFVDWISKEENIDMVGFEL
jgi:hypothetical protein